MVLGRFPECQGVAVHLRSCTGLPAGLLRLPSSKVLVGALKGEHQPWESYRVILVEADEFWPWCQSRSD